MVPIKKTVALSETMPSYQTTLVAPAGTYPWQLLIRFYAPWGDGTPEGWQTPLTPPAVLVNGVAYSVDVAFSYQQNYMSGQPSPGYDQHEQCYAVFIGQAVALKEEMEITVSGEFQQVGYMSATLYFSSLNTPTLPVEVVDNEMTAIPEAENPYISGHPSSWRTRICRFFLMSGESALFIIGRRFSVICGRDNNSGKRDGGIGGVGNATREGRSD